MYRFQDIGNYYVLCQNNKYFKKNAYKLKFKYLMNKLQKISIATKLVNTY